MPTAPDDALYLGGIVDAASHGRSGERLAYEAADLTTHGVIVGMTGSGKTGLAVCLLEEALLQGIPTLVIDPKGDMGNLLLTFPDLAPGDFAPWVAGDDEPGEVATRWREGLAGWEIAPDRIEHLRSAADFTIYTPGSTSGVPLNVVGSLRAPEAGDAEVMADEVDGLVSSLLGLVGIESDPISGREHVLLANLVTKAWTEGQDLDLPALIAQIQDPPLRKLGVIELDTFFPPADRTKLALALNGLVASPTFASWVQGAPLDIGSLLYGEGDQPRCSIVSIAHCSDEERQFVVTLLLSKLVTWFRGQSGSEELRVLVYMDEVFGFVPPTAAPPSKQPILTVLKQARAYGVGMVLATQNPVDLDYKALSNAGTWMIGRLQTERDQARLLEGMSLASGAVDIDAISDTISGLESREFVLHSTKAAAPPVFTTRWAMSYLAGPLTRQQIATLTADAPESVDAEAASAAAPALGDDESAVPPTIADDVEVRTLDPAAGWAATIGAVSGGRRLQAALVARCALLFDDTKTDLRHEEEWEAVFFPLSGSIDPDSAVAVDYDDRDLRTDPPEGAVYVLPDAKVHTKTYFTKAQSAIKDHLYREQTVELFNNPALKLSSRVGESRDDFEQRCAAAADEKTDEEADELRASLEKKADRIRAAIAKAEDRVRETQSDRTSRGQEEVLSGVGDLIGGLLGGKRSTRGILGDARRAGSRRRQSQRSGDRLQTAKNRLAEKVDELEDLEDDLADTLAEIQDDWEVRAAQIEVLEVGLEKADITVDHVALVWLPTE